MVAKAGGDIVSFKFSLSSGNETRPLLLGLIIRVRHFPLPD